MANDSLNPLSVNLNRMLIFYDYNLYKKACAELT